MKAMYSKGVTLIELIITVAIISVLAGIAIPAYNGYLTTSRYTEAQTVINHINLAQSEFFLENNSYFGPVANAGDFATASNNIITILPADNEFFDFAITAGVCGNLNQCYTVTATGKNEMLGQQNVIFDGP